MKYLYIFLFLLLSFFANAADVSQIRVNGLVLGQEFGTAKRFLPCNNKSPTWENDERYGFEFVCDGGNAKYVFDHKNRFIRYIKSVPNDGVVNWKSLEDDVLKTYGKPDAYGHSLRNSGNKFDKTYCYGAGCNLSKALGTAWSGNEASCDEKSKCLFVKITNSGGDPAVKIILSDPQAAKSNSKFVNSAVINNRKDGHEVVGGCDHVYVGKELSYSGCFFGASDSFVIQGFSSHSQRVTIRGKTDRQCTKEISCYDVQ